MGNFWGKNLMLKIISVIFAIILWLYATGQQNPEVTRNVTDVPVRVVNEKLLNEKNLTLAHEISKNVNVRVRGRARILTDLNNKKLEAILDLSDINEPGEYNIPLQIEGLPVDVKVDRQVFISLKVDPIDSKVVPVEVDISGKEAEGFRRREVKVSPETVRVTGARSLVKDVIQGVVYLNIDGSKKTVERSLLLHLINKDGRPVESKFVYPEQEYVIVTVPIYPEKVLPVKPSIIGEPAQGYEVESVEVYPAEVTVHGEPAVLDALENLVTEIVDIQGISSDIRKTVKLQHYEGIYINPGQPDQVDVVIRIKRNQAEKSFTIREIEIKNLPKNAKADVETDKVVVTVYGPEALLEDVQTVEKAIKVYIELPNAEKGEKVVPLKVMLPADLKLLDIEPSSTKVKIR